mgnify:CR=1 FL=1
MVGLHRAGGAAMLWVACLIGLLPCRAAPEEERAPDTALEPFTVTGTRLARAPLDGAFPLTVLDRRTLLETGVSNLGELLQELPFITGSPLNSNVGARDAGGGFARGAATLELRGLGAERTLILLNGRRIVPGGGGASGIVDVGMIPLAAIERVEIFKAGASVEYGADAVAGVINLITRRHFDGLEVQAKGSVTSRGDGDGQFSAVYGRAAGGGDWLAGVQYLTQEDVGKSERRFSSRLLTVAGPDNTIVADGSSAPPNGNFRTSLGRLTLIDGQDGTSPDDFRPFTAADRFNFNAFEDLRQDAERFTAFVEGHYSFGAALNVFSEALFQRRDSDTQLAPLPLFTSRENLAVAATQVFNSFGEEIADARRRLVEAGPRSFIQNDETWRVVLGADGRVGGWWWDAAVNHARHTLDQVQTGDALDERLALALGPSFFDAAGTARCGTPGAVIADCVPLDLFGGAGSVTPEMLASIVTDLKDHGFNEQTVFGVNLKRDLIALPAGPLAAAFGYEYRDEDGADVPDAQTVRGNTSGAARAITRGGFDSNEWYLELGVPLAAGQPGIEALDLDLGARLVDFSNFGSEAVFEAGLRYRPGGGFIVRAAYSEAFRAPNVGELFGGVAQSNPIVVDPCADFSRLTAVEIERCIAQGVPADGSFDQSGNEIPVMGGGNPDLGAEQADIVTAGFTWRPPWFADLELNVDYYDIEIDNAIAALGGETVLAECLRRGTADFCGRIERAADGSLTQIRAELFNIAKETARGVDLELAAGQRLLGGAFTHRVLLSYVDERNLIAFPGSAPLVGAGGFDMDRFGAIPHWRGQYLAAWEREAWRFGYQTQWIGALNETGGELFPGTRRRVPHVVYHDLHATYRFAGGSSVAFGIDNLTDRRPPLLINADQANTDVATYRLLGTTFWTRLTWRG